MSADGQSLAIQKSVRRRLPKLIRKGLADYAAFAATTPPDDAKGFAAHQTACKSALAHLDAAAKLLAWAEQPSNAADDSDDLMRMIRAAETTIATSEPANF